MKLVRVTHSFYQERPFVNIQPTNISSISQHSEPSQDLKALRLDKLLKSGLSVKVELDIYKALGAHDAVGIVDLVELCSSDELMDCIIVLYG